MDKWNNTLKDIKKHINNLTIPEKNILQNIIDSFDGKSYETFVNTIDRNTLQILKSYDNNLKNNQIKALPNDTILLPNIQCGESVSDYTNSMILNANKYNKPCALIVNKFSIFIAYPNNKTIYNIDLDTPELKTHQTLRSIDNSIFKLYNVWKYELKV